MAALAADDGGWCNSWWCAGIRSNRGRSESHGLIDEYRVPVEVDCDETGRSGRILIRLAGQFHALLFETPLEFARAATTPLDAELFNEIASEFDRARYGRHFREDEDVRRLGRALSEWESAHPATLKLRQTVARDLSEDEPPSSPLDPPEQSPDMPQPGMV